MQIDLGNSKEDAQNILEDLEKNSTVPRIWSGDHKVWKPSPIEITDRLGWLTATESMQKQLPELISFGEEVRNAGFRHIVLLGMGGSSLGIETLRQVFGSAHSYPEMIVLDSTVPSAVLEVTERIDPENTLFLVSSKSGTTTEPLCLFEYFHNLLGSRSRNGEPGGNFIAVTDPGTPLAALAETNKFIKVFLNPTDVGGRYSVLTYFGMAPAAIMGIDISRLLFNANKMKEQCRNESLKDNPGAYLGVILAATARSGRDKLSLVTSPKIAGLGLWIEQLIAESTGKEGIGILPVIGEPLLEPQYYGDDRLFVYIRYKDSYNIKLDNWINSIRNSGQPTIIFDVDDLYDLGKEFFRWEFATAIAGAVLNINPFDQPDVESAKRATVEILHKYEQSGKLFSAGLETTTGDIISEIGKGDYLSILTYTRQSPQTDEVMNSYRESIIRKFGISTTVGYGPRYLHSTGQMHKGGPNSGHFLIITTDHENDISIPGRPYSFGILADAQALGDVRALTALGRRSARVRLNHEDAGVLSEALRQTGYKP